jgi:hypothetical protein
MRGPFARVDLLKQKRARRVDQANGDQRGSERRYCGERLEQGAGERAGGLPYRGGGAGQRGRRNRKRPDKASPRGRSFAQHLLGADCGVADRRRRRADRERAPYFMCKATIAACERQRQQGETGRC